MKKLEALRYGALDVETIETVLNSTNNEGRLKKVRAAIMEGVAVRLRELNDYCIFAEDSDDTDGAWVWKYELAYYARMYLLLEQDESCTFRTPPFCEVTNGSTVCIPASIGELRKERAVIWRPYNKS